MTRARSFAPVARADARILILGSMPGTASLAAQQYYAHPYNQFWLIIERLFELPRELPYAQRLEGLQAHRLALWDVLESCVRPGSLDASIDHRTAIANDIPSLLHRRPNIERICCNGGTAYATFRRHFASDATVQARKVLRLPSTSPANASWSPARKLTAWRDALLLEDRPVVEARTEERKISSLRAGMKS